MASSMSLRTRAHHPNMARIGFVFLYFTILQLVLPRIDGQVTYLRDRVHAYSIYAPAVASARNFRQARSDESTANGGGTFEYQPFPPRTRLYMTNYVTSGSSDTSPATGSTSGLYAGSTANFGGGSSSSSSSSTSPLSSFSLPSVIKHSGTCSYDRSQAACTFSLICYLANGVPTEGCDDDPSVTCCYLNQKTFTSSSSSSSFSSSAPPSSTTLALSQPHSTSHKTLDSSTSTSSSSSSAQQSSSPLIYRAYDSVPTSVSAPLSTTTYRHTLVSSNSIPSSSLSSSPSSSSSSSPSTSAYTYSPKFANLNKYPSYLSIIPAEGVATTSGNKFIESSPGGYDSFKSLAPYEMKPYHISSASLPAPYSQPMPSAYSEELLKSAIRRSRTESSLAGSSSTSSSHDSGKSYFHEVASRKMFARNYDPDEVCGKPMAKPRSRIIGGQDAYFGEFPWQVHIKITKHQCGGALINNMFVLTAAHCIYKAPMRQLNVIIGAHDIEDPRYQDIPPQYFGVSKVILHPNFRFSASHPDRYDIALIKLDKEVRYSDSVLPVCLPEENAHFEGWKGVVTGWGKTDPALSNRYGTRLLQKVDVPIINNNKCELWHQARGIDLRIFNEMMCAGYEEGQRDACVGDSGGPLILNVNGRWTLAGITSAGFGCAQSKQPGIYHRVANTVEWIKSTVRLEMELDGNAIQRSK